MHAYTHGRHENGQNFLNDRRIIRQVVNLVAQTSGPIVEIGPGHGALTLPMVKLGRPITAVEIHPQTARQLNHTVGEQITVVTADFLDYRLSQEVGVVVGNLPFHLTTAILRKLLHSPVWDSAVLITQWEVARRRAGVGGATMMTAQWAPYYSFSLEGRVPARAYKPAPGVDGGILRIGRRAEPLLPWKQRRGYAGFVHKVFTGNGRGIGQVLRRVTGCSKQQAGQWLGELGIRSSVLPKELTAAQWVGLYQRTAGRG